MSFLLNIWSLLTSDLLTTFISLIIGFIVYKIAKFYVKVFSLPPGPIPVPLIGNLLLFKGSKRHWMQELETIATNYGPVMTFWLGGMPMVLIKDKDIARDIFRKSEFAGRLESSFSKLLSNEEYSDIINGDYGHRWEALRRVGHSAAIKYSTSDKLVYLAVDCVDQTIDTMIMREGLGKPFVPFDYIFHLFLNILATSAFGKRYDINDNEYKQIKYVVKDSTKELGLKLFLLEFLPFLGIFYKKEIQRIQNLFKELIHLLRNKFERHYEDYDESVVRDFCDALISAKNDALNEGKESAPYLTDTNLALVIFDIFLAGTDTSQQTFRWMLLFCLYYPKINEKLRQEIESKIGDRMPTHEDRHRCHYVMAFISETLRFRNVAGVGVAHKAMVNSKIANYTIPEGMAVSVFQGLILNDEKYWSNPDQFNPERFIENGEYMKTRSSSFIPFGVGRRVCLGEKLAIADLFIVLVRFVQKFSQYDITLVSNGGIDPDPNDTTSLNPKEYKISIKKI